MGKLEGKIALITGGNSGIGLATAKQFVNEGAYVFITGRREPQLSAAVKEIGRNLPCSLFIVVSSVRGSSRGHLTYCHTDGHQFHFPSLGQRCPYT